MRVNKLFVSLGMVLAVSVPSWAQSSTAPTVSKPVTGSLGIRTPDWPVSPDVAARQQQFDLLMKAAQDLVKAGKYSQAEVTFNQALIATPDKTGWHSECLQGLAEAYIADGQGDKALAAFRQEFSPPPGHGGSFLTNQVRLMEYAILLSQAAQSADATDVYNRAVGYRNYEDGEQNTPVLFPTFGPGTNQTPYNASLLQAMAHACISTRQVGFDDAKAISEAQQAAALVPNNAVVQFYLGESLQSAFFDADGKPLPESVVVQNKAAARAAYDKAAILGGNAVATAIKIKTGK